MIKKEMADIFKQFKVKTHCLLLTSKQFTIVFENNLLWPLKGIGSGDFLSLSNTHAT